MPCSVKQCVQGCMLRTACQPARRIVRCSGCRFARHRTSPRLPPPPPPPPARPRGARPGPGPAGLDVETVRRHIREAETLGAREFYFTGGEPFLHPEILALLADALAVAPTTVLTNGTLIDDPTADRLTQLAAAALYSLEIRVSLDAPTAAENDAIRGRGSFAKALAAVRRLVARDLYPIVTATEIAAPPGSPSLYERLHAMLRAAGVARPRIKILPVLPTGRCESRGDGRRLTAGDLEGFDPARLQCTRTRVVAAGGVYAWPLLAGLPAATSAVPVRPPTVCSRCCATPA